MYNKDMEEVIHLIYQGSKLAKDLESNIPNLANQVELLAMSCDEITKIFGDARDRLNALHSTSNINYPQILQQEENIDSGWLKSSINYMDFIQSQIIGTTVGGSPPDHVIQEINMDSGKPASSSSQRPTRRRRNEAEKRTLTVPVPLHGNTDLPPEDGFTWRKYGQKEILGSKFPRGYYRCTHQKMYQCPAKKQVQRLDNDPYMFEVTYRGAHICHMSSTAPSIAPSQPEFTRGSMTHTTTSTSLIQPASLLPRPVQWPSMEYHGGDSGGAGPSMSSGQYGANTVTDMVDVMFNSGSSTTTNSIDFIFHSQNTPL